jgi:hypothetical protein
MKRAQDTRTMETVTTASTPKCDYYDRDFTGCVLGVTENNGYHDSDFFAIVWDNEQNCVRTIEDGTTRAYAPSKYHRPDASIEVLEKARAWWASEIGPKKARETLLARANAIEVGSIVKVVKGRKIAKDTVGDVVWKGKDAYNRYATRIGIKVDGKTLFTNMSNVLKLNVFEPTDVEIVNWIKSNNPYSYKGADGVMVN